MNETLGKHKIIVLCEMCRVVGFCVASASYFKQPKWYHDYEWTQAQEDKFVEWMADYLFNNKEAREEFMEFPTRNKKRCKEAARGFMFYCGWKIKEGKE